MVKFIIVIFCVCVCQEYQDHHSGEEENDLYEKIVHTEREEKAVGGSVDKRRGKVIEKRTFSYCY